MTTERMIARIAAADPLRDRRVAVADSPFAEALLTAVTATDPRDGDISVARPAPRRALRVAIVAAVLLAVLAGGAYAALELLRPSEAVERGVIGLTLPAPDAAGLAPVRGSLRPLLRLTTDGVTRDLWSVRTRGRGTMIVMGTEPGGGSVVGGCPERDPGAVGNLCGQGGDRYGEWMMGRAAPEVTGARVVLVGGAIVDGAVRNEAFLVVSARGAHPVRVELTGAAGDVLATFAVADIGSSRGG